jgi:DNA-binding PadR family transcriptional regulator
MDQPQLPLTSAVFQVLVALADGERHGYALLKEVARQTDGRIRLSTGTLYGIIDRLLADGLIADRTVRDRRLYRLTPLGRRTALAEADRLEALLAQARGTRALRRPSGA